MEESLITASGKLWIFFLPRELILEEVCKKLAISIKLQFGRTLSKKVKQASLIRSKYGNEAGAPEGVPFLL